MIKVTIITTQGCSHCIEAKKILNTLKSEYNLKIEEVDATSSHGQELVRKYNIFSSPGILINDQFFAMGGATEAQLRKKFDTLKR